MDEEKDDWYWIKMIFEIKKKNTEKLEFDS